VVITKSTQVDIASGWRLRQDHGGGILTTRAALSKRLCAPRFVGYFFSDETERTPIPRLRLAAAVLTLGVGLIRTARH
jgi:hypothetical protein